MTRAGVMMSNIEDISEVHYTLERTVATVATDIEWGYEPADFFEAQSTFTLESGMLTIDNGRACLRLKAPNDHVTAEVREGVTSQVIGVFDARRLLVHRPYAIRGPDVIQHHEDGKRHISVELEGAQLKLSGGSVDFIVTNASGEVVSDSKVDRIRMHHEFVAELAPKAAKSSLLASLLRSYGAAVSDPGDELVHLYEMRDALSSHFGSEESARRTLDITKQEWQQLGRLANTEPLREGRHRGRHPQGTRPATQEELAAARSAAKLLVLRFANTVH
jgi:hypothetical protein